MRWMTVVLAAALPFAAVAQTYETSVGEVRVEQIADDLEHPWGLAFLPTGEMLVTERSGGLWMITAEGTKQRVRGVPRVVASGGQGSLLDVAVSPEFERDQTVFFTYTDSAGLRATRTAVARAFLDRIGASLHESTDILCSAMRLSPRATTAPASPLRPMATCLSPLGTVGTGPRRRMWQIRWAR